MVTYKPPIRPSGIGVVGLVDEITVLNKGSLPDTFDTGWHETARPELGQRILRVNFPRSQIINYYNEGFIIIDPDDLLGGVGLFRYIPPTPLPPIGSSTGNVAAAVAQGVPQAGSLPITVHDVNNDPSLSPIERQNLIDYISDHPLPDEPSMEQSDQFDALTNRSSSVDNGDVINPEKNITLSDFVGLVTKGESGNSKLSSMDGSAGGYTSGSTVDYTHPDQGDIGQNQPQDSGDIGNVMNVTKSLNTDQPFQGSSSLTTDSPKDLTQPNIGGLGLLALIAIMAGGL